MAKGAKGQLAVNVILAVTVVILLGCVTALFLQIAELKAQMKDEPSILTEEEVDRVKRGAGSDMEPLLSAHSSEDDEIHHHHWREKYRTLESAVEVMRKERNKTVIAAHLRIDTPKHEGYVSWLADNDTSVTLHQNLSSPIIPEDGKYQVYAQVTWSGKQSTSDGNDDRMAKYTVVALTQEDQTFQSRNLLKSQTTQMNLGKKVTTAPFHSDEFPMDTAYTSGIFDLKKGQILTLKMDTSGTTIEPDHDDSFIGYRKIVR